MRKEQVEIGKHYIAKISGQLAVVRLDREHRSGGWTATNKATNKQVRIRTAGKLRRKALPGEYGGKTEEQPAAAKAPKPAAKLNKADKPEGKYLTSKYAYKVFRANCSKYEGILILETGAHHLIFGKEAELAARVLRRKRDLSKQSFGRGPNREEIPVFSIAGLEVNKTMIELAQRGNNVFHATQKIVNNKRVEDYKITRHVKAGQSKTTEPKPAEKKSAKRGRKAKPREVQQIKIAAGETFQVRSGNPYQIRMVGEKIVYAQQLRNGKPCGPTRPFDKASLEAGDPRGTRGENSYYPKSEALEAAAKVLAKAKNPLTAKDIMQEIIRRKLWFTSGKTPHVTLASALGRDIKKHGKKSRFKRSDRGLFELN